MKNRPNWRSAMVAGLVATLAMAAVPVVAAVGDPILAGKTTTVDKLTHLKGSVASVSLKITNQHPEGSAARFTVEPGNPPFLVSNSVKVRKLNADKLDGVSVSALMKKNTYDADKDGVVDTSAVAVRYESAFFVTDVAAAWPEDRVACVTDPVTFGGTTSVVASGGMSLQPVGTSAATVWAYTLYSTDLVTWSFMPGAGLEATPNDGSGDAAMPVDSIFALPAGTYYFALVPSGGSDHVAGDDYQGYCELAITAFTGLGANIDGTAGQASTATDFEVKN